MAGTLSQLSDWHISILFLAWALLVASLILIRIRQRSAMAQRKSLLGWFSNLHTLSKELDKGSDPQQIAASALAGTLSIFGAKDGCVVLQGETGGDSTHTTAEGFSAHTVEVLGSEPMRTYLASSAERWGELLVVSDLFGSEVETAGQRQPLFQNFIHLMRAEGLRTMLVIGLATSGRIYGALLVGRRHNAGRFRSEELKLSIAIGDQVSVALENWSLNRAAEHHNEELQVLYSVGHALRDTFDLKGQFDILRRGMKDLLPGSDFSLAMQEFPDGPIEIVVPFQQEDGTPSGTGEHATVLEERVVQTRSPLLISQDWQWARDRVKPGPTGVRMRTWCGVPIHFSDGTMGVFAVANFQREGAITQGQFEMIRVLAHEAAGAFENARVLQREHRRASHLAMLNETGRKANSVLDPKELLPRICSQVRSGFGYDLVRIEVIDRERDELVVGAAAGYGDELLGRRTRIGEGLSGVAAETGDPVLANSVAREPIYTALDIQVRSGLSLPLRYHDELLGVLSFESYREHAFAPQDVLTLQALADQLANALYNARAYQGALEEAITDGLTGLKTHRYFMEELEREWRRSTRSGNPFSVIMIDLDEFKPINDQYGHLLGDTVLRTVAKLLRDGVRQSSVVARYGGDEFSILVPEATTEEAEVLGERLRSSIEDDLFLSEHRVTASFGVGSFPEHGQTQEAILHIADAGMYLAKHENGNRVRVASLTSESGQVEAYLGVEFKRKFSTGPEAFAQTLNRIQKAIQHVDGNISVVDTVTSLARALDCSDHYTRDHGQAVSRLAAQIARQLGMPCDEVEEIRRAGILHDIGKIGIPDIILYKPARLTAEEFEIMKTHSVKGQKILEPLQVEAMQHICHMVRQHHEMFDGRGYPDKLQGDQILLGARILAVADCFDTMVSDRAYRPARTYEEAFFELRRCSGTQFDPKIVKAFQESLRIYGDPRRRPPLEEEDMPIEKMVG
ncbi:MAG: diguanylate cyclase [Terriglobia bacterium]|jgi:diguanylate cyclase (GGDEF)-like protein/putative nucleotidyltransferase with HDIG domain